MTTTAHEILARAPVVPVLAIAELDHAVPLARALVDGGIPVLEVTLRTDAETAVASGDSIELAPDPAMLHRFDRNGNRI